MKAKNIIDTIGNTPHVALSKLYQDQKVEVWLKLERSNPGGSIKDRIAMAMIEKAEETGDLKPGYKIIEPTSGNTGIGLAMIAAVKNYDLTLVMPESMSIERRRIMASYGANLELTPKEQGMKGAISKAKEMVESTSQSWMPMQFDNEANVEIHRQTTIKEIEKDFPEGLDYIITGVGTGGHISACAELKKTMPNLKVFAVEPALSPVLSGGEPGPHPLQGIGAGFIPSILNPDLLDGVIQVEQHEAFTYAQNIAKEEGIFVGISSGASLAAVAKKIPDMKEGSKILTFSYDTGERYLSIAGLFDSL